LTKRKKSKKKKSKDKKIDTHFSEVEKEISWPTAWLRAVQKHENVASSYVWSVNKERIYDNYNSRFKIFNGPDGREQRKLSMELGEKDEVTCEHAKYSHEELLLPNGKVIVPIRQFCETKILPAGTKEAFFFNFGKVSMNSVTEVDTVTAQTPVITSSRAETVPSVPLSPYAQSLNPIKAHTNITIASVITIA